MERRALRSVDCVCNDVVSLAAHSPNNDGCADDSWGGWNWEVVQNSRSTKQSELSSSNKFN